MVKSSQEVSEIKTIVLGVLAQIIIIIKIGKLIMTFYSAQSPIE